MYGDMMYCNDCGRPFMDVWRGHDTRTENVVLSNCPFCNSCSTLNASGFIAKYEKQVTQNRHSATALYKHMKELYGKWIEKWIATKPSSVFLTKKESDNFDFNYAYPKAVSSSPNIYIGERTI